MKRTPLTLFVLLAAFAGPAHADSIRLLDQAGVAANADGSEVQVTLADVAELEGDYAVSLGDLVVGRLDGRGGELSVQLVTVRRILTEAQTNWSDLSLRGRSVCLVSVVGREAAAVAADNDHAVTTRETLDVDQPNAGLTVGDLIIQELVTFHDVARVDLEIQFRSAQPSDVAWLNRSVAVGRYEIEVLSRSGLGVVPLKVWRYDPAGMIETVTLSAEVARRAEALVVVRQLRRGEVFGVDNVALRSVLLTADHGATLDDMKLVLGQPTRRALREGAVLRAGDVAPSVLVRRGQLVTVSCISGALVVRTVATATQDGTAGDIIPLRNPETRDVFFATVTGRQAAEINTTPASPATADALAATENSR